MPDKAIKSGSPESISDWFIDSRGSENVTRRKHVWGLLCWYHMNVRSQYTFRAWLKRLWYRLTFRPEKAQLYTPFEDYLDELARQRERQRLAAAAEESKKIRLEKG